jgi:hypothetical protein
VQEIAMKSCTQLIAASLLFCSLIPAADVRLVHDGKALATVVVPAEANAREKLAAKELRHYVQAICGVDLPLREDGKQVNGTGLYIGHCAPTQDSDLPDAGLNPETYVIRVRNGNLFFTGNHPTPVYFAVASFLEQELGVRWFAPGELWEDVPTGTPGELVVSVDSRVVVPGTSPRVWSGHNWGPDWNAWNLRNKTVLSEVVPRRQFQNRVHTVFPTEKYAKDHPEYYPLIKGKRWIPPAGMTHWRPCEANPEVQQRVIDFANQWFDTHPTIDSFSVGMDDISHLCSCPLCRAWDPHPDSYEKRQFSDRHYRFVNAIAKGVARTHPDRYIGTLIYNIARNLPETVDKLEPNVFGFITETSALWWQEGRQEADHELTRQWAKRCAHLSRYDYYGMGCFTPRFYPHAIDQQIKFDKSLGMEGMYIEVYTFLPHTAPMIWLTAKLQWDHRLNADALLAEFYQRMYGPAAPTMTEYWNLLETSWNTPRPGRDNWVHRRILTQALAMGPKDLDAAEALLGRAMQEAGTEKQRQRIAIHRDALRYSGYAIRACAISQELDALAITDAASAETALQRLETMARLSRERKVFYAEVPKRDDLLGKNVKALTITKPYFPVGDFGKLEAGSFAAMQRLLAWTSANAPERLAETSRRLQATGDNAIATLAKAYLWLANENPPSLLQNGDFEAMAANDRPPAQDDWQTAGAPTGWSTWSRTGRATFGQRPAKEATGKLAAAIAGADSATYLQAVPAKPGDLLLCLGRVQCITGTDSHAVARIGFRFRTPAGKWHKRRDLEGSAQVSANRTGWQDLALLIEVPEGAASVLIMPGASGQQPGDMALFDNLRVYRIPQE